MGYTLTKSVILRNQRQLEQLLHARATMRFKTDNPKKLASKLREAIAASFEHEEFNKYSDLKTLYKFRIVEMGGDSYVLAIFQETKVEGEKVEERREEVQENNPDSGMVESGKKKKTPNQKRLPDAEDVMDVVGSAIQFKNDEELYFPNAYLEDEDRKKLLDFCLENGWAYIDHDVGGVTLTKKPVPEEIQWRPRNI